jgi:TolB protein
MMRSFCSLLTVTFLSLLSGCAIGPFTGQQDIGKPSAIGPGVATFDAASSTLRLTGGGANVWGKQDDLHFVWKKVSGSNLTLAADVVFEKATPGAVDHRKAVLMIRQSLDPNSSYADACVHGNGMTALQWREAPGENSYEIQANADGPRRLRIEKHGNYFSMSIGNSDADLHPAGGACKVELTGDYYIGLGVCSHSRERLETASFSNIALGLPSAGSNRFMISTLEVYQDNSSRDRRVVWVESHPTGNRPGAARLEAPNWVRDNSNTLLFNFGGHLYKVPAVLPSSLPTKVSVKPELLNLGILTNLNNDHVISFDNTMLGVSDSSQGNRQSSVSTIPMAGGVPTRITTNTPSYLHGWSPDGKTLVFAAARAANGNNAGGNWDIYSVPATGGAETRLTTDPAREDGPEFSPDGQYIYFNSSRSGKMQIWRMRPDGSNQEQVTHDDFNNWFPHISPNGQKMAFISFPKTERADNHDSITDVELRLMTLSSGDIVTVAKIFGGQGTINVPSWSPDSRYFAFMSYQLISQ